jgi:hypothetical protein
MLSHNSVTFWCAWGKLGVHEGASGLYEKRLSRLLDASNSREPHTGVLKQEECVECLSRSR